MNLEVFTRFSYLIREHQILNDRHDHYLSEYKARLYFNDQSILEFTEILIHHIPKRKYSFQWMTQQFELIIRWDNASHHRHIPTFPHHKHMGEENRIESSQEMFLQDVLQFIDNHQAMP